MKKKILILFGIGFLIYSIGQYGSLKTNEVPIVIRIATFIDIILVSCLVVKR